MVDPAVILSGIGGACRWGATYIAFWLAGRFVSLLPRAVNANQPDAKFLAVLKGTYQRTRKRHNAVRCAVATILILSWVRVLWLDGELSVFLPAAVGVILGLMHPDRHVDFRNFREPMSFGTFRDRVAAASAFFLAAWVLIPIAARQGSGYLAATRFSFTFRIDFGQLLTLGLVIPLFEALVTVLAFIAVATGIFQFAGERHTTSSKIAAVAALLCSPFLTLWHESYEPYVLILLSCLVIGFMSVRGYGPYSWSSEEHPVERRPLIVLVTSGVVLAGAVIGVRLA